MKQFALVLGGGAAKGYAHIGVIKTLEKYNIKPDLIVGTSMGALVGGMYASGKTVDEMIDLSKKITSIGSFDIISALFKDSLLNVNKIKKLLENCLGDKTIEECDIPFMAMATELNTGKEKAFSSGLLREAIMASISIPVAFPKVKIGDNYYCDGGLLNNLPEDVARENMPKAIILSIDVIGDYTKQIENLKMKTIEIALNSATLVNCSIVKNKAQFADLRIEMSMPDISQMDLRKETVKKAIQYGEIETERHIDEILKLLGRKNGSIRKNKKKSEEDQGQDYTARSSY